MHVPLEGQLHRTMQLHLEEGPARGVPLERLKHLVSPLLGICQSLTRMPIRPGEPPLPQYEAKLARIGPRAALQTREGTCGIGYTEEVAQAAALGEAAETWSAACVDMERVRLATWRELSREHAALEPERFALYSEQQHATPGFPYHPFTRDTPVGWVEGWSLVRQAPVWVPASRRLPALRTPAGRAQHRLPVLDRPGGRRLPLTGHPLRAVRGLRAGCLHPLLAGRAARAARAPGGLEPVAALRDLLRRARLRVPHLRRHERCGSAHGPRAAHLSFGVRRAVHRRDRLASQLGPGCREGAAGGRAGPALILSLLQQDPDWQPGPDFANVVDFEAHGRLYTSARELLPVLLGIEDGSPPTCRSRRFRGWEEGTCRGTSHGSRGAWPSGATKRWWWT